MLSQLSYEPEETMSKIEVICVGCSSSFLVEKREVNRGNGKFCSKQCFGAHHSRMAAINHSKNHPPNVRCDFCKINFYQSKSRLSKRQSRSGLHFCSRACKDQAQRIENGFKAIQPDHYGKGQSVYRDIAFRFHPKVCNRCGYSKQTAILEVHHKDCDRSNNLAQNLEVLCPTCHEEHHFDTSTGKWKH